MKRYLYLADNVNNQRHIMRKDKKDSAIFQIMLYLIMTSLICFFMNNTVLGLSAYKGNLFTDSNQTNKTKQQQNRWEDWSKIEGKKNIPMAYHNDSFRYMLKKKRTQFVYWKMIILETIWHSGFYMLIIFQIRRQLSNIQRFRFRPRRHQKFQIT